MEKILHIRCNNDKKCQDSMCKITTEIFANLIINLNMTTYLPIPKPKPASLAQFSDKEIDKFSKSHGAFETSGVSEWAYQE